MIAQNATTMLFTPYANLVDVTSVYIVLYVKLDYPSLPGTWTDSTKKSDCFLFFLAFKKREHREPFTVLSMISIL